ncbi:MAG: hypothetical protein Q8P72_06495 [Candidatus Roizmanbacteria bacterium]|nr:hypothetical protein [Candidatus Roizmanbacteria bacterium]
MNYKEGIFPAKIVSDFTIKEDLKQFTKKEFVRLFQKKMKLSIQMYQL